MSSLVVTDTTTECHRRKDIDNRNGMNGSQMRQERRMQGRKQVRQCNSLLCPFCLRCCCSISHSHPFFSSHTMRQEGQTCCCANHHQDRGRLPSVSSSTITSREGEREEIEREFLQLTVINDHEMRMRILFSPCLHLLLSRFVFAVSVYQVVVFS